MVHFLRHFLCHRIAVCICGLLLSPVIRATAQDRPSPPDPEWMNEYRDFVRLAARVDNDPSLLNQERLEDLKYFNRLTTAAGLIKPCCPSLLVDELPLPELPVIEKLPPGLKELWVQAASQPETELQLKAAEAIARASGLEGADWQDTIPLLVNMLDGQDSDRVVRLAAARSLLILNARDATPILRKHAGAGMDFAQLIEPVLADWNDPAMQSIWLRRLESGDASPGLLILAIQAAATTDLKQATPFLRQRVFDQGTAPHLRIEAARAMGKLSDESVVPDAAQLVTGNGTDTILLKHLLAVHLLIRQSGIDAVRLLQQLAVDPEPAVASTAFRRLLEIGPALVMPAMNHAADSPDPGLRSLAAEALFLLQTPSDVTRLSGFLADPNLFVRSAARQWLIKADAVKELNSSVRGSVMDVLNSDSPRGIAQAAVIVGVIDHEPAADRLIALLNHEAGDVSIAAAWALRRLAVAATAEPILQHLRERTEKSLIEIPIDSSPDLDWIWDMYEQHKHLIEALGILNYRPADQLLRMHLAVQLGMPLNHPFFWIHCTRRPELRARAVWALGQIHSEQFPEDLVASLRERLEDEEESPYVSAMAALALGKMKVQSIEPTLRNFYAPDLRYAESFARPAVLAQACRLALQSITGESLPPLPVDPFVINKTGWFLEPL